MATKNAEGALLEEITPENFGTKLDLICKVAGISLTALAEVLDEEPSTLSHIRIREEKREPRRKPSPKFMDKLRALASIRPKGLATVQSTQKLTSVAVVAGLNAVARTKFLGSAAVVAGTCLGGIVGGFLTFGVLRAVAVICKKQGFSCKESEGELEISKDSEE